VGVTVLEYLAFASRIVARASEIWGATSTLASVASSSVGVRRTGWAMRSGA
jgi:hypothetical protein